MVDFLIISTRTTKHGVEVYPRFRLYPTSQDLMVRGGDFYAIWDEELGAWSTVEQDALRIIDHELDKYAEEHKHKYDSTLRVLHMWDSESGMIDAWHKFCQKQMRDSFHMLDENLIFANSEVNKKDYASKRLNYPLEPGSTAAYDRLISTLYSEEERHKIEWAIGSIVSGDSKNIQKFLVLYGEAGAGKSTILNIIQKLFDGYYSVFDAKALGSNNNQFALEAFKKNPLVAIQHDGDLSGIQDNTQLNSLVSHEEMTVNEKFKSTYTNRFKCFLFMGTNKPVKITDAKSGLIRRLIDVTPSGKKLSRKDYNAVVKQIDFELGAIAHHCREVYLSDPGYYDDYMPLSMMGASNDFYNFMMDSYQVFKKEDGTTLKAAWEMYKTYCDDAKLPYPLSQMKFKEELKNYFWEFNDRFNMDDGSRVRSYYSGFRTDKFEIKTRRKKEEPKSNLIRFEEIPSIFDKECLDCPAQYASSKETPCKKWDDVTSKLSDLDTSKLHFVKVPENHIVIDFDIRGKDGKKNFDLNLVEASKWPPTYAELSKSGAGIHLHYIYTGDVNELSRIYDDQIEIKTFTGKSSLRRKLTKCNNLPIATISSGLPRKEKKMVNFESVKSEKGLRTQIKKCLNKEHHGATAPEVSFINKILDDAYENGIKYDVSDMRNAILAFAANSTNQADACVKMVNKMKFKSEEPSDFVDNNDASLVFYDVEVFPNLFLINWKIEGEGKPVVRMINPTPSEIEELCRYRLVGFNCRRYDNHILYGRLIGYDNEQLYKLSQKIVTGAKDAFFGEAYNLSYTDVYDFAATKQSLKKWEIDLGIHHQELGLPWDQPVPKELWEKVAEYCDNDVIATEAVFNHLKSDWTARQILADLAGMSVNDTTNTLTTRFIFGTNRTPQNEFCYRDLSQPVFELDPEVEAFLKETFPEMMSQRHGEAGSLLPYFPDYKFENGKSYYRGEEVGEGGWAEGFPGIYVNIGLDDVASMHPHSAMAECVFGPRYTRAFRDIVYGRVNIKHEAWDVVNEMLDGKLKPYITKVLSGEITSNDLAYALKIAINSVYGLTAAKFTNAFKDPRNKDNIVAKRGALFMLDLREAVREKGFKVCHIKTDSIKIENATPEIIEFVYSFGKRYGYTFEHEATYEKMCLVNDAVYIAKYAMPEKCKAIYDYVPGDNEKHGGHWTATGTQFQVPYVFKTLFSNEQIEFADMCEAKSVTSQLYLDMNETLTDVSDYEKIKTLREKPTDKLTKREQSLLEDAKDLTDEKLDDLISKGHDYRFVGKVGQFCPIKPGCGGGVLLREKDGKYYAATGSKGYRWLESEMVKTLGKENEIDRSYYNKMVDDAVDAISQYGDFEQFVSDDPVPEPKKKKLDAPPWKVACGKDTCEGCEYFSNDAYHFDCAKGYDIGDMLVMNMTDEEFDNFKKR